MQVILFNKGNGQAAQHRDSLQCLRIPADADQHSWVIAITIPA